MKSHAPVLIGKLHVAVGSSFIANILESLPPVLPSPRQQRLSSALTLSETGTSGAIRSRHLATKIAFAGQATICVE